MGIRSLSIVPVALLSSLTTAVWSASPTDDAISAEMRVEFDAAGLALREAMALRAAGNTAEAADAERSARAHRVHYLALRQRLIPTPAISTARDPFSPDASWRVEAKEDVAVTSTALPRWDLYGLALKRDRQGWDLYARAAPGDLVNRQPDRVRAQQLPDAPDEAPPSAHPTSTVLKRESQ